MKGRDERSSNFFDDDAKQTFEEGLDRVSSSFRIAEGSAHPSMRSKGFTQAQLVQLEEARLSTDEREREIAQIAESINDLATMFRELSVLVVEQVRLRAIHCLS